jgi:hypothetical protein
MTQYFGHYRHLLPQVFGLRKECEPFSHILNSIYQHTIQILLYSLLCSRTSTSSSQSLSLFSQFLEVNPCSQFLGRTILLIMHVGRLCCSLSSIVSQGNMCTRTCLRDRASSRPEMRSTHAGLRVRFMALSQPRNSRVCPPPNLEPCIFHRHESFFAG